LRLLVRFGRFAAMRRFLPLGFALTVIATPAYARGHSHHRRIHHRAAPNASYFLAGDPHVPLAVVKDGHISDTEFSDSHCGATKRWKALKSSWQALDAWGQPLGTFKATSKDDYDATGCAELSFSPQLANDLTHVFVSADSVWQPSASVEWSVPEARRVTFKALAKKNIPDANVPANFVWPECKSIPEEMRFFHAGTRGDWAIATSNAGFMVAAATPRGWKLTKVERSPVQAGGAGCFRPVAVFDMNGDGVPEIVIRFSGGDGWNDFVLGLSEDNRWELVAASPGGSTA
jgi:hypothetical protein